MKNVFLVVSLLMNMAVFLLFGTWIFSNLGKHQIVWVHHLPLNATLVAEYGNSVKSYDTSIAPKIKIRKIEDAQDLYVISDGKLYRKELPPVEGVELYLMFEDFQLICDPNPPPKT